MSTGITRIDTDVKFKQRTEIVSVSFYPVYDKDYGINVVKSIVMVITMEITIWLNDVLIPKNRKIIRQELTNEEYNKLILKIMKNGKTIKKN